MRKTVHRLARLAAFAMVGAALMVPMAVAAADTSIQPLSATLVAKGAEVDVTVSFTCPAGYTVGNAFGMPGGAGVYLQQAVSKTEQAAGTGFSSGQTCTGQPQTAVIPVLAFVRPRSGERSRTTVSQWTRCGTRLLTGLRCQLQLRLCCVRTGDPADQPLS